MGATGERRWPAGPSVTPLANGASGLLALHLALAERRPLLSPGGWSTRQMTGAATVCGGESLGAFASSPHGASHVQGLLSLMQNEFLKTGGT